MLTKGESRLEAAAYRQLEVVALGERRQTGVVECSAVAAFKHPSATGQIRAGLDTRQEAVLTDVTRTGGRAKQAARRGNRGRHPVQASIGPVCGKYGILVVGKAGRVADNDVPTFSSFDSSRQKTKASLTWKFAPASDR